MSDEYICLPHNSSACKSCADDLRKAEKEIERKDAEYGEQWAEIKCLQREVTVTKEYLGEAYKALAKQALEIARLREALEPFAFQAKDHTKRKERCNNCGMRWPCEVVLAKEALTGGAE